MTSALAADSDAPDNALLSYTVPADGLVPEATLTPGYECSYWSRPAAGRTLVGIGTAVRIDTEGTDRFDHLTEEYRRLQERWIHRSLGATSPPAAFIGFSFDPHEVPGPEWRDLANTRLSVPAVLYRSEEELQTLTFTVPARDIRAPDRVVRGWLDQLAALSQAGTRSGGPVEPVELERITSPDQWTARIDRALGAIHNGPLDKIVLTRRVTYRTSRELDCARVLASLRAGHEDCAQFALARDGCTLLGVSPERLASFTAGTVVVDALAGTAPRGQDARDDRRLADALLADTKVAEEHRLVVEQIRETLDPLCTGLVVPQSPSVMRLPRVQHLWTPLRGHVRPGIDLLRLASRLHPTPAVGGSPRAAALEWLATERHQSRGWYTGAFGWLDASGSGELSVVLRCGLINGRSVDLFAGAGIVSRSRPQAELAETEWKLLTMRGALQIG